MPEFPKVSEDREALDWSAEALRVMESEILLRSAAWVAILQGALGALAAALRYRWGEELKGAAVAIPVVACLAVYPWLGSWVTRILLVLACLVICLFTASQIEPDPLRGGWDETFELAPILVCLTHAAMGALLLQRSRLGRDVLLALAGSWLVRFLPGAISGYLMVSASRVFARGVGEHFVTWALLFPSGFVSVALVSRAGRSSLLLTTPHTPLASITGLWRCGASVRAWAAVLMIPLTCLLSVAYFSSLGSALRGLWW